MTDFEVYGLVFIAMALSFSNWRFGVVVCFVVGFLQDPLRKLVPGEPVVFTALVAAPLATTMLGARLRNVRLTFKPVHTWSNVLRRPLKLFMILVVIQSFVAVLKTGNPIVGTIGALSYLAPLPAILLSYQFIRNQKDISKIVAVYLVVGISMVLTVYLSYAGYNWTILKQVGTGLFIYSFERGRLNLYSGFLRSPEIAAWHAATAVCLLILMSIAIRRNAIMKFGAGALALSLIGVILLTGRRKFLVEVFLFVSLYVLFLICFQKSTIKSAFLSKSTVLLTGGLVLGSVAYMFFTPNETVTDIRPYYERGVSVSNDVTQRVSLMTLGSFQYVIAQNGLLGSGAGTGSQGVQHFGGQITGLAAEGGLAKVLAELGVPGLALLLWLVVSFARYLWLILKLPSVREVDPTLSKLTFGLIAFLATNGVVYVIAHQVFGDPFVLIILGFFLGFVMAAPKIVMRDDRRRATIELQRTAATPSTIIGRTPTIEDGRRSPQYSKEPARNDSSVRYRPNGKLSPLVGRGLPSPGAD